MAPIAFRPAELADVAMLAQLVEQAFEPTYGEAWNAAQIASALSSRETFGEVALREEEPVGFTLSRAIGSEVELLLVGVEPASRKIGLGRRLLRNVAARARALGADTLMLEVRESNFAAVRLYKSAGFLQVGRRTAYYAGANQTRHDAITMSCPL